MAKKLGLVDTHCHLNFKAFRSDYLSVAAEAKKAGLSGIIIVGADWQTSQRAVEISKEINRQLGRFARAAVGIHPTHCDRGGFEEIARLAEDENIVAIGECGMDRFHEQDDAAITAQRELFIKQIDLALKLNKPLIIHNRQADEDILAILNKYFCILSDDRQLKCKKLPKMVFHCFSSDWKFAEKVLGQGAFISFTGNITYGNKKLKKVVEKAPIERIMIETDSPYLIPEPLRSEGVKRNEPAYVIEVAKKIAQVKKLDIKTVLPQLYKNSVEFFGL